MPRKLGQNVGPKEAQGSTHPQVEHNNNNPELFWLCVSGRSRREKHSSVSNKYRKPSLVFSGEKFSP